MVEMWDTIVNAPGRYFEEVNNLFNPILGLIEVVIFN